jgi:CheY-like chemotaxis protein
MIENHTKILIVEDDTHINQALSDLLNINGYDVSSAFNGQEGLEKAISVKPDLILLDIFMPVMTGLQVLEKLRQDEWGKTIPVIILTNDSDSYDERDAVLNQVSDYILKSNTSSENLIKRIKNALNNRENDSNY